jgi:predicted oxidoreductase
MLALQQYFPDVSPLVFGCMGLGGDWNSPTTTAEQQQQGFAAIEAALELGFNCFDHADIYTRGKAEALFGQFLAAQPELRECLVLQSKCAIRFADANHVGRYDFSAGYIADSVEQSLRRLQTDYLDILLLHRPDPLMQIDEVAEVLSRLQQSGKVRQFGVSNFGAPQQQLLQSALQQPLVVNQLQMSLANLDWLEANVLTGMPQGAGHYFGYGTVEYCQLNKVQIQAWGSLAQGRFSGGGKDLSANEQRTADLVARLAAEYQVSAEAIVLGWLLRHPAAIQPVIGTVNPARIRACSQALDVTLSREHWYALYVASRGQPLP